MSGVAGGALLVGAIGLGLMVIRNDLDSGAIAAILAKPVSRLAYAGGKLAAAAALMVVFDGLFAIGTIGLLALDGGGHEAVVPSFFAILGANALIWMVLVTGLTVY